MKWWWNKRRWIRVYWESYWDVECDDYTKKINWLCNKIRLRSVGWWKRRVVMLKKKEMRMEWTKMNIFINNILRKKMMKCIFINNILLMKMKKNIFINIILRMKMMKSIFINNMLWMKLKWKYSLKHFTDEDE